MIIEDFLIGVGFVSLIYIILNLKQNKK